MTTIVAVKDDLGVWLGADSAVRVGDTLQPRATSKLVSIGLGKRTLGLGVSGLLRFVQLLRFDMLMPSIDEGEDFEPDRWMSTVFVRNLRSSLELFYAGTGSDERHKLLNEHVPTYALAAFCGRIFFVDPESYAVSEISEQHGAIGTGYEIALGALHATAHGGRLLDANDRLHSALWAACHYDPNSSPPFDTHYFRSDA